MVVLFVVVGWVFSLCCHEFGHAIVAYLGGDKSVKDKGYLTFNPLKYAHPVTTLLIPIGILLWTGGFALPGGAVYIERDRLKGPIWDSMVSLAGPAANLVLAVLMSVPFMLGMADTSGDGWFWPAWAFLIWLQIFAFLVNLLPIPPLDGFGAIAPALKPSTRDRLYAFSMPCIIVLIILLVAVEPVGTGLWRTVRELAQLLGVEDEVGRQGAIQFDFF